VVVFGGKPYGSESWMKIKADNDTVHFKFISEMQSFTMNTRTLTANLVLWDIGAYQIGLPGKDYVYFLRYVTMVLSNDKLDLRMRGRIIYLGTCDEIADKLPDFTLTFRNTRTPLVIEPLDYLEYDP
jgi:hypothetical protein